MDTPVQVRLYKTIPHINYIVHGHVYVKGAPFTKEAIPCGALEEVDEIMELIYNSNSSNEEMISILRSIADDMESSRSVRNDVQSRWSK